MRTSLCLLPLFIGALPLAAQLERFGDRARAMPPDFVSQDVVIRDIVRLGSSHVRVDLENDRARVLRLTLGAGEAIPLHDDRAGVLVCIAGCRIRFTAPDGKAQDVVLKAGETRWMAEGRRAMRNLADGPVEMLYIENKRAGT